MNVLSLLVLLQVLVSSAHILAELTAAANPPIIIGSRDARPTSTAIAKSTDHSVVIVGTETVNQDQYVVSWCEGIQGPVGRCFAHWFDDHGGIVQRPEKFAEHESSQFRHYGRTGAILERDGAILIAVGCNEPEETNRLCIGEAANGQPVEIIERIPLSSLRFDDIRPQLSGTDSQPVFAIWRGTDEFSSRTEYWGKMIGRSNVTLLVSEPGSTEKTSKEYDVWTHNGMLFLAYIVPGKARIVMLKTYDKDLRQVDQRRVVLEEEATEMYVVAESGRLYSILYSTRDHTIRSHRVDDSEEIAIVSNHVIKWAASSDPTKGVSVAWLDRQPDTIDVRVLTLPSPEGSERIVGIGATLNHPFLDLDRQPLGLRVCWRHRATDNSPFLWIACRLLPELSY